MSSALQMSEVRKSFGTVEALRGVSLSIEPGQVVAMLGPNGAGKTTSIGIMLGLRRPTAGSVRLLGMDPWNRRARSRVGAMLQESGTPQFLKVRELVEVFRSYYPDPLPTTTVIAMAGLEKKAEAQVQHLSGGQQRRLQFALAICGDPEVIFLDEPTVGMDVEGRQTFWAGISEFIARGRTIVLTTHYLEEADQVANRIVVIDHGQVLADAPPAEIKAGVAGRRVSFVSAGSTASTLDGLPVHNVRIEGDRMRFLTNEPESVLAILFSRGIPISELEVVGADLEEAFLSLTGSKEEIVPPPPVLPTRGEG